MGYSTSGEFTNAERTKLTNIEASADVTDTANVGAANAVMDADFSGVDGLMKKTGAGTYDLTDVLNNTYLSAAIEQSALFKMCEIDSLLDLINIVTEQSSNVTFSSNTTITDKNNYRSLTVDAGVTLTINTTSDLKSGVILAYDIINNGTISRTAQGGYPGEIHRISTDTIGTGGNGGNGSYGGGGGSANGTGGTGSSQNGQNGGSVTHNTKTSTEISTLIYNACIDYLIETIESKTLLSTTHDFIDIYGVRGGYGAKGAGQWGGAGAGGGGLLIIAKTLTNTSLINTDGGDGGPSHSMRAGGGGGSGGAIIIIVDTYDNNGGVIRSNGGVGGNGGASASEASGGGGGGAGGIIYILYKTQTNAGTLTVAGSSGGTGTSGGGNGTVGGAGHSDAIQI
jgi:hypothetical protein